MNAKTRLATLALGLGLTVPALANDEHHPEKAAGASTTATAPAPNADAKAIEANAAKLQAQAKRIARTKPGPERDRLVAEHMRSLHESMEMAKGMMSGMDMENCPMMEGMMGAKGVDGAGNGFEDAAVRIELLGHAGDRDVPVRRASLGDAEVGRHIGGEGQLGVDPRHGAAPVQAHGRVLFLPRAIQPTDVEPDVQAAVGQRGDAPLHLVGGRRGRDLGCPADDFIKLQYTVVRHRGQR